MYDGCKGSPKGPAVSPLQGGVRWRRHKLSMESYSAFFFSSFPEADHLLLFCLSSELHFFLVPSNCANLLWVLSCSCHDFQARYLVKKPPSPLLQLNPQADISCPESPHGRAMVTLIILQNKTRLQSTSCCAHGRMVRNTPTQKLRPGIYY